MQSSTPSSGTTARTRVSARPCPTGSSNWRASPATRSEAIRAYREETGTGLAEAEAHVATGSCLVKHEAKHEHYHDDQQLTNADLGFGG